MLISAVQQSDSVILFISFSFMIYHREYGFMYYAVGLCCLSIPHIAKPLIHIHLVNLHNNLMSGRCCYACLLCSPIPVPRAAVHLTLYVASLVLIYLQTGSLDLLTVSIQFPPPSTDFW